MCDLVVNSTLQVLLLSCLVLQALDTPVRCHHLSVNNWIALRPMGVRQRFCHC